MEHIFKDFGKVILRTPLYSYLSLFEKNDQTKDLDDFVRLKLEDPVFLEALYWSSPQLFYAALKFKEGGIKGPKEDKLMQTLKKISHKGEYKMHALRNICFHWHCNSWFSCSK